MDSIPYILHLLILLSPNLQYDIKLGPEEAESIIRDHEKVILMTTYKRLAESNTVEITVNDILNFTQESFVISVDDPSNGSWNADPDYSLWQKESNLIYKGFECNLYERRSSFKGQSNNIENGITYQIRTSVEALIPVPGFSRQLVQLLPMYQPYENINDTILLSEWVEKANDEKYFISRLVTVNQ